MIDRICENEYIAEYWINEQIFKEIFTPFMLKNDFRKLDDEKIFKLFKTYLEENFEKVE